MKSYITKPVSLKKNEIISRFHSFLPSEHRKVNIKNINTKTIQEIQEFENVWTQIDVSDYLSFITQYYLGTISCMQGLLYDEKKGENISPENYKTSSKQLKKGDFIISRNASLGKISYIHTDSFIVLNWWLSYLRIQEKYRWYFPAFFITNYGTEYLVCATSWGWTQQNAKRQNLLDVKIPFPTSKNHLYPEKIEQYISCITQNIIDKEEQIKLKNEKIDELIEQELRYNQKTESFCYSYPKINEIKEKTRLDTWLYEREFKEIDFLIRNYERGFSFLDIFVEKFFSGTTPKFFEKQDGNYPYFVRPTEYNDKRIYTDLRKIHFDKNISKYRIDKKEGIILPRKGGTNTIYKPENFNVLIGDSIKFGIFKNINVSFLASFLSSNIVKFQLERIKSKTNGGSLTENNLRNLLIPNFSESKQEEIAKLYYSPLEKNKALNLENYLEKEKMRNSEVGIFQLNMEIFELREKLEELIHKIIMEEAIDINFTY
jgi:hypothetical protein